MAKTTIRRDSHGLYVRGGGYLFRPLREYSHVFASETTFREGNTVTVSHTAGTPLGRVKDADNIRETWFSHGVYLDLDHGGKLLPSDFLWKPAGYCWE